MLWSLDVPVCFFCIFTWISPMVQGSRTFSGKLSLGPNWSRLQSFISEAENEPLDLEVHLIMSPKGPKSQVLIGEIKSTICDNKMSQQITTVDFFCDFKDVLWWEIMGHSGTMCNILKRAGYGIRALFCPSNASTTLKIGKSRSKSI